MKRLTMNAWVSAVPASSPACNIACGAIKTRGHNAVMTIMYIRRNQTDASALELFREDTVCPSGRPEVTGLLAKRMNATAGISEMVAGLVQQSMAVDWQSAM